MTRVVRACQSDESYKADGLSLAKPIPSGDTTATVRRRTRGRPPDNCSGTKGLGEENGSQATTESLDGEKS